MATLEVSEEELTEGPITRTLLVLAAPLLLQNLVHVANNVIDTFWVGRLGEDAVAGVGLNFPVLALIGSGVILVAVGTQLLVAQRVGADNHEEARRIVFTGMILGLIVGIAICVAVGLNADRIMLLLGQDQSVAALGGIYLATMMVFYPFVFVGDTIEYGFIGWGDTRAALRINLVMVGTNVVLDPFLIFGWWIFPALGVQGAALASGIGILLGLLLGLAYALGIRDSFRLTRDAATFDRGLAREILSVGVPLCGQRSVGELVRVLVIGLVAVAGGAAGVAAYTVGARVAAIAIVPALGLQQAAQSMIGQNLGADRPDRALRVSTTGVVIAGGGLTLLGLVQWVIPGTIVSVLVPDLTTRGHELAVLYLRILALSYWALGITYLFVAGFNGASRTRTSFMVDLLKYWGVRFPIAVLAIPATATVSVLGLTVSPGLGLGVEAIFWAVTVSNVVAALGVAIYFLYTTTDGMFHRAADRARDAALDD